MMNNVDLSKITQEELDQIIKEEALKIKQEMILESRLTPKQKKLMQEKEMLESTLKEMMDSPDLEEGIFGKLFGGGNKNEARKQTVLRLLKHPAQSQVLLMYATPEQIQEFKSYMPDGKQEWVDWAVKKLGTKKLHDGPRADSYISFFMNGGKHPTWDAQSQQYADSGSIGGGVSTAFAEGEEG